MSLIMVRPEQVEHPYYVEPLGVHIGSSQELCYVIYNNLLIVMNDFVNDRLIDFIRRELGRPLLADRLSAWKRSRENPAEMLAIILDDCNYYTTREVNAFRQRIESLRKMTQSEFWKETADNYYRLRQYGTAVRYYEKILDEWRNGSLTDEFTANVWNNVGACYAGIFWFEKAMGAYEMSYNFRKEMSTIKKLYLLTLLNPELVLKDRYRVLITEEKRLEWKAELRKAMEEAGECQKVKDVERLFDRDPIRRAEGAEKIISRWKREYRKML
ncbi:hypothetical protein SAMN04487771_100237 [[Clostridium] aminophilum]|uniref:Tetratricopeptide repeat-containing protein n=1 Tax=[Clostridium] aminophilum TaxID=1526 RepID=A0A1I0AHL8_9FIRM|nr:hypothetical protein [[Clostridium] aminophilum]SES93780.1 hypothetical protein SAMN04487771_100237 [[Clostridium] aminophilum]